MNKYDKKHKTNLAAYALQVDAIYKEAARKAALLGVSLNGFDADKVFAFADYPILMRKAEKLVRWLHDGLVATIEGGVHREWALSNTKNDALADKVLAGVPAIMVRKYYNHNGAAEEAFLGRKEKGLALSDRVWRYTDQFKQEIELGIDLGIRAGRSAEEMSRDIRLYLQHPDKLFRRVRDEHGQLVLSKAAKAYNPGRGVYRSSYKNARRLAVTETNMAYRTADHERWQQMDFVLGQHVLLSNNHTSNGMPLTDICNELSGENEKDKRGRYPKDFKFTGWHPLCRCHVVPIMAGVDEMEKFNAAAMRGERYEFKGQVEDMPEEFGEWMDNNADRIAHASNRGTLPYFLKDNNLVRDGGKIVIHRGTPAAEIAVKKKTALEIAADRHAARTPEQIADIMRRADERQKRLLFAEIPNVAVPIEISGAKTFKGLEAFMNGQGFKDVKLTSLTMESAKEMCAVAYQYKEMYNLDGFDIRALGFQNKNAKTLAWASARKIEANIKFFGKKNYSVQVSECYKSCASEYVSEKHKEIDLCKQNIDYYKSIINRLDPKADAKRIRAYEKEVQYYETKRSVREEILKHHKRHNVFYSEDTLFKNTVQHEGGHVIHDQITGGFNAHLKLPRIAQAAADVMNKELDALYAKYKNDCKWLSEYGSTDRDEFMAESMVMYQNHDYNLPLDVVRWHDKLRRLAVR